MVALAINLNKEMSLRGRKPEKFELKPTDKAFLQKLLRDGQTPLRIARRAQILLDRTDKAQRVGAVPTDAAGPD